MVLVFNPIHVISQPIFKNIQMPEYTNTLTHTHKHNIHTTTYIFTIHDHT